MNIDVRYLEGLTWNGNKVIMPTEKDKEGRKRVIYEKVSRKLVSADVLDFKEVADNKVCFVTSDGRKYFRDKLSSKTGG